MKPATVTIVALAAFLAVVGFGFTRYNPPVDTGSIVTLGPVDSFPAGSITEVEVTTKLELWVPRISANSVDGVVNVPMLVVSSGDSDLLVLYGLDPHVGCRVKPVTAVDLSAHGELSQDVAFINPCHGEMYDLAGGYLDGPAPRGLDRFESFVDDGMVMVDLTTFAFGPSR